MKKTLPGFCVTQPVSRELYYLAETRHFQRLLTGKLTGVDPKICKDEWLK